MEEDHGLRTMVSMVPSQKMVSGGHVRSVFPAKVHCAYLRQPLKSSVSHDDVDVNRCE